MQLILQHLGFPADLINGLTGGQEPTPPETTVLGKLPAIKEKLINTLDSDDFSEPMVQEPPKDQDFQIIPKLHSHNKHPKIQWFQNDIMIKLVVQATDCEDYSFEVDTRNLCLIVKFADHFEVANIKFFGAIDPSKTSHELRGLNIVIRFLKLLKIDLQWPRLTEQKSKNQFITYNLGAIDIKEEIAEEPKTVIIKRESSESEDVDSEESDNDEDVFNPIADQFVDRDKLGDIKI
jgi:hypothetical protein